MNEPILSFDEWFKDMHQLPEGVPYNEAIEWAMKKCWNAREPQIQQLKELGARVDDKNIALEAENKRLRTLVNIAERMIDAFPCDCEGTREVICQLCQNKIEFRHLKVKALAPIGSSVSVSG